MVCLASGMLEMNIWRQRERVISLIWSDAVQAGNVTVSILLMQVTACCQSEQPAGGLPLQRSGSNETVSSDSRAAMPYPGSCLPITWLSLALPSIFQALTNSALANQHAIFLHISTRRPNFIFMSLLGSDECSSVHNIVFYRS